MGAGRRAMGVSALVLAGCGGARSGVPGGTGSAGGAPPVRVSRAIVAQRFEIVAVGDSTFDLLIGDAAWVRSGQQGIAVDPRRRDALVARFALLSIAGDTARALVTGQTQRVSTDHVALLVRPPVAAVRQRAYWQGVTAGGLVGAAIGVVVTLLTR